MTRLDQIKLEDMTKDQLEYLDVVMKRPVHKDMPRTEILKGPYNAWLRSPNLFVKKMMPLIGYLREGSILNDRLAELAIITVGRVWSSEFEFAAHAPNALAAGISQEIVDAIKTRQQPVFDKKDEEAVFNFANELTGTHEVCTETYNEVMEALGEQAVVELMALMGFYVTVCMTLNTFEVQVPVEMGYEKPFPDK